MADIASYNNVPWYSVHSLIKSATIGSGITAIGKYALNSCTGMATVSLPEGLTTIGDYAFNSCSALETVSIPATVTKIGNYAFRSCTKLATVSIPSTVTTIGSLSTKTGEVTIDNDAWYSLDGRRVVTPTKGVYIKNGRKVVIK